MKPFGFGAGSGFAVAVLAVVAMLVVPLPPWLLDALLALDILVAAAVLVVALTLKEALEFATFPTLLLVATLFRLSLDVSATRLILTQGGEPGGVGSVIPAFGAFVMRGSVVVGLLMFLILVVVQLLVVTNGAQRVAEVAARFTLDAMPGKQMAIDAELHAGVIDAIEARRKRAAIQAEADFYGAMDGAGKFVRGDAIAALVIVAINILAGIGIGVVAKHMDIAGAARTFALLSVGNALATTVPAFLLSTAMGVIVTRAASDQSLGDDLLRQALAHAGALRTVGAAMLALALVPGLPHLAFGVLGALGLAGGRAASRADERRRASALAGERQRARADSSRPEGAVSLLGVEQVGIDLGEALLPLLDEPAGSALLSRIGVLRRCLALELGIVLPGVHVRDDLRLPERGFAIRVRDRVVARGELHADRPLAIGAPAAVSALRGEMVTDAVTGQSAKWLEDGERIASDDQKIVVDPIAVLTSRLGRVVRRHAASLLGRQEVQWLLDHVRRTNPAAVKGIVPELAGLGLVQRVLQYLVRERVSIRDLVAILETIADEAEHTKEAAAIAEAARRRLAPAICAALANEAGVIKAVAFAAATEARLSASVTLTERGALFSLEAVELEALARKLAAAIARADARVIVCAPAIRLPLARLLEASGADTTVLSLAEIASGFAIEIVATLEQTKDVASAGPE
ncbi:MAG: FHIPEP family type III secretion protein [Candidatus Eremiobacteraeota bacterium]|nr:FHIPEP family type III secretion protein [Candidatus Eremiobacteraeota bacterium]MBV8364949.1 FHIPEP family type III secretion protein [Candidatus Eremiobacteraeota bacterium]